MFEKKSVLQNIGPTHPQIDWQRNLLDTYIDCNQAKADELTHFNYFRL